MHINDAIDSLYTHNPAVTTIDQFDTIYQALFEIDDLIELAEAGYAEPDDLEFEEEVLTPAGLRAPVDERVTKASRYEGCK
jgi:hypothetical protein